MPIVQVQVAPGQIVSVNVPDAPGGEPSSFGDRMSESLFAGSQKLGAGLANLPVSVARGINWLMDKAHVPNGPSTWLSQLAKPNYFDEVAANADKASKEKGIQNDWGRAIVEAIPGIVASPGALLASPGKTLLANVIPAVATETAGKLAGDQNTWVKPVVGLASGLVAGAALGPTLGAAKGDVNEALKGVTPSAFADAQKNLDLFKNGGLTTGTVAEAFPPGSSMMTLAQRARAGSLNNPLRSMTENRIEDLRNAGDTFKNRIGPRVDENTVANQAGGAATGIELLAKRNQQEKINAAMAKAGDASPYDVAAVYNNLLESAANAKLTADVSAYKAMAQKLIGPDGKLITNVQALSYAVRNLKQGMKNPQSPTYGDQSMNNAVRAADEGLRRQIPEYDAALTEFANDAAKRQAIRQGPVGSLSDKNPLIAGQTSVARLTGLLSGNSPQTIKNTAQQLQSPVVTGAGVYPKPIGEVTTAQDIARALAQQKLSRRPDNPGQAMRGNPGSDQEAAFNALLEAAGKDPSIVNQPLQAADKLTAFANPANLNELPKMQWRQALLRPFRTLDMMMSQRNEHGVQEEIAKLLARKDPAIIGELQKIAMFDPTVRKELSIAAGLNAFTQQGNR